MEHQATLTYSEPLIRRAVFGFWRRSLGASYFVALLLVIFCLVYLLYSGDRSWLVGVLASVVALGVGFSIVLFAVHYRTSTEKLRAMGSPLAALVATESSLSLSSGGGVATLPWSSVSEIWQFPTFWLLLFSKAQFATLPLNEVSPVTRAFILERVRAAGGKTG